MKDEIDWNKLFADLATAKAEFEVAERAEMAARSRETAALNEVNRAQAAINKALQDEKKGAPRSTDWHRELHPPRDASE